MKIWIRIIHNKLKWFTIWEIYGSLHIIFYVIHFELKHELPAMGLGSRRSGRGKPMWLYLPAELLAANIFWGRGKHCISWCTYWWTCNVPVGIFKSMITLMTLIQLSGGTNKTKRHEYGKESHRMVGDRGGREIRDGGDEVNKIYIWIYIYEIVNKLSKI